VCVCMCLVCAQCGLLLLEVGFGPFKERYTSIVRMDRPLSLSVSIIASLRCVCIKTCIYQNSACVCLWLWVYVMVRMWYHLRIPCVVPSVLVLPNAHAFFIFLINSFVVALHR